MASMLKLSLVLTAVDRATAVVRVVSRTVERLRAPAARVGEAWGNLTSQVRGVAAALALAGGIAGTAAFGFKRVADEVDRLNDQARQLGITTQRLQELGFAAQMNGSSAEALGQALEFLAQNMVEARNGSKETQLWFARAGITMRELQTMKVDEVFERIADTYLRVGDAGQNAEKKIAMSRALMGRGGAQLNQMLNQGKATLRQYAAEANRLGIVLDTKTVDAMAEFNDQVDRARSTLFGSMARALGAVTPRVAELVGRFTNWVTVNDRLIATRLVEWFERLAESGPRVLTAVANLTAVVGSALVVADQFAQTIGGWDTVLTLVAGVIALKMVVAVVALTKAVGALTVAAASNPFFWAVAAAVGLAAIVFRLQQAVDLAEKLAEKAAFLRFMPGIGSALNYLAPLSGSNGGEAGVVGDPNERRGGPRRGGTPRELGFSGTLKIEIDSEGRARVRSLSKDSDSQVDMNVVLGRQMRLN
ncbi:MAG: hypothetical protein KIT35_21790 [Piscinibacter sp.]|uniref:hypothetical protein n=1 Tax=Piscinibacter sp. TaxID=1903157 RepID=UPI00258851DB|nr:hypothetical protein [Piscinibacter sp.]MCW5666472.1 hypothetical protein [Piscinibacter sp.]